MDDTKCRALFCEAIALLKEIVESRGQFYNSQARKMPSLQLGI